MKVSSIFDAVRTIDDVLEYTKQSRQSGISHGNNWFWNSIWFPGSWIPTKNSTRLSILGHSLFSGFELSIQTFELRHNGFATNYFSVDRETEHRDPLSPLLSILSQEVMACILQNDKIKGISIKNEEVKCSFCWWHDMLFKWQVLLRAFEF